MKSVNTKLPDEIYDAIIASGSTPYKFLQEAAIEKLHKGEQKQEFENLMLDIVSAVNSRLENFEKELATSNTIAREKLAIIAENLSK